MDYDKIGRGFAKIGAVLIFLSLLFPARRSLFWYGEDAVHVSYWLFGLIAIEVDTNFLIFYMPDIPGIIISIFIIRSFFKIIKITDMLKDGEVERIQGIKQILLFTGLTIILLITWIILHRFIIALLYPIGLNMYGSIIRLIYYDRFQFFHRYPLFTFSMAFYGCCSIIIGCFFIYLKKEN